MKNSITLKEAVKLVGAVGQNVSVHLEGEPGIGKSSMLKDLAKMYPNHTPAYIDCADLDLGDLAMPVVDHVKKATAFYPNERFSVTEGKPVIIMLDELTKAAEPIKNMLLPVILERRLGSVKLHPDSIVYSTGNLTTDAVGDNLKAHARNRITTVSVRKPNHEEWLLWASDNDVAPEIGAWVKQFPHSLASYTEEAQKENLYIYNPRKQQKSFVTPRSLAKASFIVNQRKELGEDVAMTALIGTIGDSAARDMSAFFGLSDALPTREEIMAKPDKTNVPKDPSARVILVLRELMTLKEKDMTAWMTYLQRLPMEEQALFGINVMASSRKAIAATNKEFVSWAVANNHYF